MVVINSRLSSLSLQVKLTSCILLISIVLVGFSAILLDKARRDYVRAQWIDEISHCDGHLILAIENLAFERGRTNVVLAAATPISSSDLAFIQSRRQQVDVDVAASLDLLTAFDASQAGALRAAYAKHLNLRQRVDEAVGLPAANRPPKLREEWFAESTDFIHQLRDVFALLGKLQTDMGQFDHYHRYQFNGIEFRLLAGKSASVVTAALNKAGLFTPAEYQEFVELRAQADYLWFRIAADTADLKSAALTEQKNRVEQEYYREYRPAQEKMLETAMQGGPRLNTVAQLSALSVLAFDSIFVLSKTANQEAHQYALKVKTQAEFELQIAFLQFVLTSLFVAFILHYFHRRLFQPLNQIVLAQKSIIAGEATPFLMEEATRRDEIGLLAQGVNQLQLSMSEERRLKTQNAGLAMTDRLTGLHNRQFLDQEIDAVIEHADRYREPLSLIIFDLDHFKAVNDTWGHPIGDEVLKQATRIASGLVRKSDLLVRIGGEEFLIVMPQTDLCGALAAAEKIRAAMATAVHPIAGVITASFGVAERQRPESFKSWYKRCDEALYQAKQNGRNQVTGCREDSMPLASVHMEWLPEWESGNLQIDAQHQALLAAANQLLGIALLRQQIPAKILPLLDNLFAHITSHFACEEIILGKLGYQQTDEHTEIHRNLVAKALNLKADYEKGTIKPTAFFSFIVDDVITGHMISVDSQYFALTRSLAGEQATLNCEPDDFPPQKQGESICS